MKARSIEWVPVYMSSLLGLVFFLSGAAALVFEALWFHQAGLAFGNSVWATSIVLASFMAGLALGNALSARYGHRTARPVGVYALLELVVGASGALLVFIFPEMTPWLSALLRPFLDESPLLNLLRFILAFALLLAPATAMGATLPLLVHALRGRDRNFASALGKLYGWNTLGAVGGVLLAEVVLVAKLGIRGSAAFAAGLNVLAAAAALGLGRVFGDLASTRATGSSRRASQTRRAPASLRVVRLEVLAVLAATALAGATLLGLEVLWFRFLLLFVHSGSLVFAVMLAVVLCGISVGGFAAAGGARVWRGAHQYAGMLALLAGVILVVTYRLFALVQERYGTAYVFQPIPVFWLATSLMLPTAALSGILFTFMGTTLRERLDLDTHAVGLLTLANTLGAAVGALVAGFIAIPWLGMERSFFAAACLYGVVGLLMFPGTHGRARRAAGAVASLALAAALLTFPFGMMQAHYFQVAVRRWDFNDNLRVQAIREGRGQTLFYVRHDFAGQPEYYTLLTDGYSMSGTQPVARRYMRLYAYLPMALHTAPKRALLISYGVGSTAKVLTDAKILESIDIVDISQEILEMSSIVFPDSTQNPLHDPRVHVHVEDGRYFLQTSTEHFDIITGEPPPPKVAGVVNLYTREYFQLVRDRLAPGGIHTYWLPVHNLTLDDAKAIIRAYCDVFDDCTLWTGSDLEWMLVGTQGMTGPVSEAQFSMQWHDPQAAVELRQLGFECPEQIGALFMADAGTLRQLVRSTLPLVDDRPKRLGDRVVAPSSMRTVFVPWMDTGQARGRFERSDFIARLWPPDLRQRSLPYFDVQRLVNEVLASPGPRGTPARYFGDLHALLTRSTLRTAVLWHLGVNADVLPIINNKLEAGGDPRPFWRELACSALAERDYERAIHFLTRLNTFESSDEFIGRLRMYALCMAGRCDEAVALAMSAQKSGAFDSGDRDFLAWLASTFSMDTSEITGDEPGP